MKAVDLFCGCGGISAGLRAAGVEVIAGSDIEPHYLSTFSHNFPHALSLSEDLSSVAPSTFMDRLHLKRGQLDLLVGGPPCQGFSKNVPRKHRYLESSNNLLVKTFLDYVEALQPRFVVMENVAEMKNGFDQAYSSEILERLEGSGYRVEHDVLNAASYGIPQRRRRAFFVGARDGIKPHLPKPTHSKDPIKGSLFPVPGYVTVEEAIGDLPAVEHGGGSDITAYQRDATSDYQKLVRNSSGMVRNHIARKLADTQYARLAALKPGQGLKDLPEELKVKGGYSGAYGRLTWDMVAPTITRWVFHPGSGRWGHPRDTRVLTIREVARIQGFPDFYEFVGSYTQQAGQLGNAVPPLLMKQVVEALVKSEDQTFSSKPIKSSKDILSLAEGN